MLGTEGLGDHCRGALARQSEPRRLYGIVRSEQWVRGHDGKTKLPTRDGGAELAGEPKARDEPKDSVRPEAADETICKIC